MTATYLLFGEPSWQQMLFYAVVFFGSLGAFVFTVYFIYMKVFRGREDITSITLGGEKGQPRERR